MTTAPSSAGDRRIATISATVARAWPNRYDLIVFVVLGAVFVAIIHGAQNICFAVASNLAAYVVAEIVRHGRVRRSYIGVVGQTTPIPRRIALRHGLADRGVLVMDLAQSGPASAAGVKPGDLLVRLGVTPILGNDDLVRALNAETVGKRMELAVLREGDLRVLSVTPAERPVTS